MALTWGTLIAGAGIMFGLPAAIILLNLRRRNAGWLLLVGVITFVLVGNIIEQALMSDSPIFG